MERELSAGTTGFYKFAALPLWLVAMGGWVAANGFEAWRIALWLIVAAYVAWACAGLKRVQLRDSVLVVSNYVRTEEIALDDVDGVRPLPLNPQRVRLELRKGGPFGTHVDFVPRGDAVETLESLLAGRPTES